jgi:FG-GAP repeat/FG-GAP-like repeat
MSRSKVFRPTLLAALVVAGAVAVGANAAGTFVEPGVQVLTEVDGTTPDGTTFFGWAVSPLKDVDGDQANDFIVGEPFSDGGSTYVYSGRTGRLIYRVDGASGDWNGFAMADAGDTNGDGVHDFIVGSPGNDAGHVDLYSGRTGELLHRFVGENVGDAYGWAVSSAGDVDHDGRADILVGAPAFFAAANPGFAYVYSGRTYALIRKLTGDVTGDAFGSGTGWTRDVNRDGVPDQIVGARDAGRGARGRVYVYSGKTGDRLFSIGAGPDGNQFGSFFVAGVGDVNRDGTPDVYAADYADTTNGGDPLTTQSGRAGVYSGKDGHELLSWVGPDSSAGLGPGRGAGDVNHDGHPDLIVGSYSSNAGATNAGRVQIFSGKDGSVIRTITSTTENEQFGFDAVDIGDVNRDGIPDELVAAANGNHVYVVAGARSRGLAHSR